jgi:hypothetical protein
VTYSHGQAPQQGWWPDGGAPSAVLRELALAGGRTLRATTSTDPLALAAVAYERGGRLAVVGANLTAEPIDARLGGLPLASARVTLLGPRDSTPAEQHVGADGRLQLRLGGYDVFLVRVDAC